MAEAMLAPLAAWQSFYIIMGTAAATLTGLMFVVMTLIVGARVQGSGGAIGAFSSPNVLHFEAVLLFAAFLNAPWPELWNAGLLLGLCGLGGVVYVLVVVWRTRQQTDYQPVLEDWLWHMVFPLISYMALVVAAMLLPFNPMPALFIIGAVTLLLLFTGIHNAWDNITYVAVDLTQTEKKRQD